MPRLRIRIMPKSVKKPKIIVDIRINETLHTRAVRNRTYRGCASVSLFLDFTINAPSYCKFSNSDSHTLIRPTKIRAQNGPSIR